MKEFWHVLEDNAAREKIPSVAVAIRQGEDFSFYGTGNADVANGLAPDENTIYPIGSCSKAFIATAIMMLCEDGKLSLNDPVNKHLSDFKLYTDDLTKELTIRDMLSHNSGLSRHDLLYEVYPQGLPMRELVRRMRYMPPVAPFRYRMLYQNHMFTLASLLVEEVSGIPWNEFLQARIFRPAGMTRTFCNLEDCAADANRAKPYKRSADGSIVETEFQDVFESVAAAGSISSTSHDMDRWLRLQLGRGVIDGTRIFTENSARHLHSMQNIIRPGEFFPFDVDELDFESYGLGWLIQTQYGHKMVAHGGAIRGFRTLACFLPDDDMSFTVICNLDGTNFHEMIAYQLSATLLGHEQDNWLEKVMKSVMPAMMAQAESEKAFWASVNPAATPTLPFTAYCGQYASDLYGNMEIAQSKTDTSLFMKLGALEMDLICLGNDSFECKLPGGKHCALTFIQKDGAVIGADWKPETMLRFQRNNS